MPVPYPDQDAIKERVYTLTGQKVYSKVEVVEDTTQFMNITRGNVLRLGAREFFVLGDMREPRFGMNDQPKYWVKRVLDLDDDIIRLIKLVFHEEFTAHIGPIRMRCWRSPEKEARVLDLTQNDDRFMHGVSMPDANGNVVRIIDFIEGPTLYDVIMDLEIDHETYFQTMFPTVLRNLVHTMEAIRLLHQHGLCHGDIRNDHIMIESGTRRYRWIDFDLTQRFSDFDVWSFGNVLQFTTGMGMMSFHEVRESERFSPEIGRSLSSSDAAAFYKYRIMNLRKIYGYIPERLNRILMRFSLNTKTYYETMQQVLTDVGEVLDADFPAT